MAIKIEITNTDPNRTIEVYGNGTADDAPTTHIGPGARVGFYIHAGNSLLVAELEPELEPEIGTTTDFGSGTVTE